MFVITTTIFGITIDTMPKTSLKAKLHKLVSKTPKQFVQQSQYIFDGFKSPSNKALPYAVMLAHASETTTNRESFKSYRKRFAQQTRRVDDFLSTVDSVLSKLP